MASSASTVAPAAPVSPLVSKITRKRRNENDKPWSDRAKKLRSSYNSDDEETLLLTTGYHPVIGGSSGSKGISKHAQGLSFGTQLPKTKPPPNPQGSTRTTQAGREETIPVPVAAREVLKHGATKIFTSSVGLFCGLHALINSMEAQYPQWKLPHWRELFNLAKSREFDEFHEGTGYKGLNSLSNFRADQLALILKLWGEKQEPRMNLRLGVIVEGLQNPTIPPGYDHSDTQYLWIHNDGHNLEDDDDQDGNLDPFKVRFLKLGHYSGIRPKPPPGLPEASSSQGGAPQLRGGTSTAPTPVGRRERQRSPSPSEPRKRRRLSIQGSADDYIQRKWAELKRLVEALVKDHFPPSMPKQFTQEERYRKFQFYSPLAASIVQSNSYGAYIFQRHIWWNLVWRMLGGHSRFWVGKEANTHEDVSRHVRAKDLIQEQDRLYTTNAYHLATGSNVGAYIVGRTSKERERIQAFLARKASQIRDMYNDEVPEYNPDDENDPVNALAVEIMGSFWSYLQLSQGIHDPGDVIVNDCISIIQCAAEINIVLRTQLAQYVLFFPVAGQPFMDDRCSLLVHPTQVVTGEKEISLAVTPALFKISNFAETQTDAEGNGFVIRSDVLCNLVQQDVENE